MTLSAFLEGVAEFNQQNFYSCHDILEALWIDAEEVDKKFYQGVLQVAVGCYHLGNFNWRGAVILLGEGINRLTNYQPEYKTIDVSELVRESYQLLQALQQIQPEQVEEFVDRLESDNEADGTIHKLPQIRFVR